MHRHQIDPRNISKGVSQRVRSAIEKRTCLLFNPLNSFNVTSVKDKFEYLCVYCMTVETMCCFSAIIYTCEIFTSNNRQQI